MWFTVQVWLSVVYRERDATNFQQVGGQCEILQYHVMCFFMFMCVNIWDVCIVGGFAYSKCGDVIVNRCSRLITGKTNE